MSAIKTYQLGGTTMKALRRRCESVKLTARDMALTADSLNLLHAIGGGQTLFEPESITPDALERFQRTVKLLRELEGYRCIAEICSLNLIFGERVARIDRVRVVGGLTNKGRAVLMHNMESRKGNEGVRKIV